MSGRPFLDTIWARLIAGLVALTAAGALAYISRDALFDAGSSDNTVAECLQERLAEVETMIADGVVKPGQAAEYRIRARQACE